MRTAAALVLLAAGCAAVPPPDPAVIDVPIPAPEAPASDRRAAFRAVFCATLAATEPEAGPCEAFLWRDPTEAPATPDPEPPGPLRAAWRVVMVSGYASDCVAPWFRLFGDARPRLAELGVEVLDAPVAGLAGTRWNAAILAETLRSLPETPGMRTLLVGYSKGAADILEMLGAYPEAAARVDAFASISGALSGAQLAETAPHALDALIEHAPGTECGPHDGRAMWSLRPDVLAARLAARPWPSEPPLFVLASFVGPDRVSHALAGGWKELAARDALSDGQLTVAEQFAPGAVRLGHPRGDHWAVALPIAEAAPIVGASAATRNAYPRTSLIESVIRFVDGAT